MTPIKIFILGLGRIGALGIENAFEFMSKETHMGYVLSDPSFELVGAWDTNQTTRERISSYLNGNINLTEDFESIDTDVFVVSSPAETHYELILKIIKLNKAKLILCEKPFGKNLTDAQGIQCELRKYDVGCFVNYPRSYSIFNSNIGSELQFEIKDSNFFYINVTISDSTESTLWHLANLLFKIDSKFVELLNANVTKFRSAAIEKFILDTKYFTLNLNILKRLDSSYAEAVFLFKNSTYYLLDGISEIYKSCSLTDMGWRKFHSETKSNKNLLYNTMELFYSEAVKFFEDTKSKSDDIERAIRTHKFIDLIQSTPYL
jgi:hypothetical protein